MKRMWAVLVLLILTVTTSVLGIVHTRRVTSQMEQTVSMAKDAVEHGDGDKGLSLSQKAVKDWRDEHHILCLYMVHSRLEAIDQTLTTLPELCKDEEKKDFLSECDRGIMQIDYLNESEIPNLDNIF